MTGATYLFPIIKKEVKKKEKKNRLLAKGISCFGGVGFRLVG